MWEAIIESLEGSGPAVIVITLTILLGNVFGVWVWGYVHRRDLRKADEAFAREREDKIFWMEKTLVALGLGEEAVKMVSEWVESTEQL